MSCNKQEGKRARKHKQSSEPKCIPPLQLHTLYSRRAKMSLDKSYMALFSKFTLVHLFHKKNPTGCSHFSCGTFCTLASQHLLICFYRLPRPLISFKSFPFPPSSSKIFLLDHSQSLPQSLLHKRVSFSYFQLYSHSLQH
jgi:hypothetical protein